MPMLIKDAPLEKAIERQAKTSAIPATKTAFTVAIVRTVLAAAEARKVNVRDILNGLTDQGDKPQA